MNSTDEIDNEDVLFQFDPVSLKRSDIQVFASRLSLPDTPPCSSSYPKFPSSPLTFPMGLGYVDSNDSFVEDQPDVKGKGLSQPMFIRPATNCNEHDMFAISPESASLGTSSQLDRKTPILASSSYASTSAEVFSVQTPNTLDQIPFSNHHRFGDEPVFTHNQPSSKGKSVDYTLSSPPILPQLRLSQSGDDWSQFVQNSTPGPSSYNSSFAVSFENPTQTTASPESIINLTAPSGSQIAEIRRLPSRRRSYSNLSIHSTRSAAARSLSKAKVKFQSRSPSNIARKLLFRKRTDTPEAPAGGSVTPAYEVVDLDLPGSPSVGQGSCFLPGCGDLKSIDRDFSHDALYEVPVARPSDAAILKGKGRSYSSPFPLASSPLDIISAPELNPLSPTRVEVRDFFDEMLPRELKLHIFASLVSAHEADFRRMSLGTNWSALKASSTKNKWVGRDKGLRELIKLGRVSKTWRSLVFDGHLWRNLDLSSFPKMPPSIINYITDSAGHFVTSMNLLGHNRLLPDTMLDMSEDLCLDPSQIGTLSHTQLTSINLQGCSSLTTGPLHQLLIRCPLLERLCLKGLKAVTNNTCDVLSVYCRRLLVLNMSRCSALDGEGIRRMASAALTRDHILPLKELRLSGLRCLTDTVMSLLGKAAPGLEVLDLSYALDLHNSAIDAFVACDEEEDCDFETVSLTPRQAGRDAGGVTKIRKRVTCLRHVSLSSCVLLTDIAASHLAHAVPRLEILEMGGIGPELRDEGLVLLLNTTPHIRKVDLEDAVVITDVVIRSLTPDEESNAERMSQPGHALEHLVVSCAANIHNDTFAVLIRRCTKLRILEADGTRISGSVVKEFIRLSRQRDMVDARIVAVDCRHVGDSVMKDISTSIRPRMGWRSYDAKKLAFLDSRDKEQLDVGQDECDEKRVVLKTFYSWQIVDLVSAAREKKQKTRKGLNKSGTGGSADQSSSERSGWWAPRIIRSFW